MIKTIGLSLYNYLNKRFGQQLKRSSKQSEYTYQIELDCGEPTNIKGFKTDELSNQLLTHKNAKTVAFFLFLKQFERIGVVIYYLLMILHFSFLSISEEDLVVYIVPLTMHFVLQVSKALYFDNCKSQYHQQINSRGVTKFRRLRRELISSQKSEEKPVRSQEPRASEYPQTTKKGHTIGSSAKRKDRIALYENTYWQNLEVGDIVYVKRYEVVPADLLIIDISDEIFEISTANFDGCTQEKQKHPTQLTVLKNSKNKTQGFDYKKILNGIIQYDRDRNGQISGFIKLKKDPKGEYFYESNVLLREEQLKTCQYAIGVVLFGGRMCQCYQNAGNKEKQSFFVQKSNMFFLLTLITSLLITLISWMFSSFQVCQQHVAAEFSQFTLIFYLTQYVKTTPIFFYNCIDLLEMVTAHYKYYHFKSELGEAYFPKQDSSSGRTQKTVSYQQLNPTSVGDLVMTEYVCLDKTGTLTSGDFRVRAIIIEDMMYKFSHSQLQKNSWAMFKENFQQQIKSNPNFRIAEQDELEEEHPQEDRKARSTGIFRMNLNQSNNNANSLKLNRSKNHSNVYSDKQVPSADNGSVKSLGNVISNNMAEEINNMIENLKPEDLDDTHCRITPDLRTNKPKPFFNKSIVVNQSLSIHQSPPQSPFDELQLINQQSFKNDEQRSLYSEKNKKPRTNSDATQKQVKRQVSIKRALQDKIEDDVELIYQRDQEFYQRLVHGMSKYYYQEAILAMMLCQEITSRYNSIEDSFIHDSTQQAFDQELMRFAAQFDIRFVCSNEHNGKINYVIEILGDTCEFQILAINPERPNHPRLGILVQFPDKLADEFGFSPDPESADMNEGASCVLIVREELNQLPPSIDMDKFTREYWDKVFAKLHVAGMRTLVYSKIYLKEKDKNDYLEKYSSLRFQNQGELVSLFNEIEKDLQIIQVVGVKEKIRNDATKLVQQLKEADLSVFMLSGDDITRCLPVAFRSGVLSSTDTLLHLDGENSKLQIKNHLAVMAQQVRVQYQSKSHIRCNTNERLHKSITSVPGDEAYSVGKLSRRASKTQLNYGEIRAYSLLLSGDCFQYIQSDPVLASHFAFVLYFCNTLIGYKFSGTQKGQLIQIVQTQFQGNKRVLAIGDAFNDTAMFRQANIGIQYCHFSSSIPFFRGNTKKRITHRLSCLNTSKMLENPLRKTHFMRDMWVIPTADICVTTFEDLNALLFFESRIYAEVYDDLLVFSFYRSLLILYILFFMHSQNCSQNNLLLEGSWLTVYQSIMLFLQQIASLVSKLSKRYEGGDSMYREQFKGNIKTFKKKKVLSFIFKINGNATLDALLLWLAISNMEEGEYALGIKKQMIFLLLVLSDLIKLSVSALFGYPTWAALIAAYCVCWLILAGISVIYTFDRNFETFTMLFTEPTPWFSLIFYLCAQFCLSSSIESLQPLFCTSLIRTTEDYVQIQNQIPREQKKNAYKKYHNLIKRIAVLAGKIFKKNNEDMDISIQDIVQGSNLKVNNQDRIHLFTLRFTNKDTEMKFKRVSKIIWLTYERYKLVLSLFFLEVVAILIYIFYNIDDVPLEIFFIMYIISISINTVLLFIVFSSIYSKHFFFINLVILLLRFLTKFITDFNPVNTYGMFDILLSQSQLVIILFSRVHMPIISFILAGLSVIGFIRKYSVFEFNHTLYIVLNGNVIVSMTCLLFMALQYKLIRLEREQYMLAVTVNQETTQMTNVLSILLPKFIRDRINAKGVFEIQENQGNVAILFCDICGFDDIIAEQKENIVNLLDILFRAFDSLCNQNGMQKIETVGKTYMAAGGLKACDQGTKFANQNPVKRALQLAVEMQDYTKKFKFGQVGSIVVKIGLHYGRVIAGVIGHHKPQFSLIGDTVNTTSRVCSTGQDGQITLSLEAYNEINIPEFQFIERRVNAKGKGELITFQVNTQVQRGSNKHTRKRAGLIPKNEVTNLKLRHQPSLFAQQQHTDDKADVSSKSIQAESADSKQDVIRFRRRVQKGPTLLLRNLTSQQNNSSNQIPQSQFNVIQQTPLNHQKQPSHSILQGLDQQEGSISQLNQAGREDSFTEKSNLLVEISQKLRRDLQVDYVEESPDYEIEIDKVRLYYDDDNQVQSEKLQLERRKLYLDFKDNQEALGKEFMEQNAAGRNMVFISLYLHLFQFFLKTVLMFLVWNGHYFDTVYALFFVRMVSSLVLLIVALLQNKKLKQRFYQGSYFIAVYALMLFSIALEACFIVDEEGYELQASEGILLICFLCSLSIVEIKHKVIFLVIFFITQLLIVTIKFGIWALAYYTVFQSIMMFIVQYNIFLRDLSTFNNKRSLELKKAQSQNLVKYLLPNHILKQFLSNNNQRVVLTENIADATLLFADIAGFTEYSSKVEPEQVVNMLRNLFTEFDKKCLTQNVYKLYTIGDCYVVMGIVDITQRNPAVEAKNVVELGFQMIEIIRNVRRVIGFDGLDMRIGIHTGSVIGGILGTEIVRYDVYGADVMISNKMESNGERGRVQVSEETKQMLEAAFPDMFSYSFNKMIEFKSINRKTNGYFIDIVRNDSNDAFEDMDNLDPGSDQLDQ